MCFFGDIYYTELDLQRKFWVSNKNLVSIDIEEFWYQTNNISIDIVEFWYQASTTSVAYCASTGNCVLYEYWTNKVSIEYQVSNRIQLLIGIEQNLALCIGKVSNQVRYYIS